MNKIHYFFAEFSLPLVVAILVVLGLFFCLVYDKSRCSGDVKTPELGEYKIIEVETHGEKHEYLYFHRMHGRSLCHLPNCKYCKKD